MIRKRLIRLGLGSLGMASYLAMGAGAAHATHIGTAQLSDDAVTSAKIAANTIQSIDLATDSVGALEIKEGAVGTDEIKDAAIRTADIRNGTVLGEDISSATKIVLAPEFDDGSNQAVEADATFDDADGSYSGGAMGNVFGTVTNGEGAFAGLIGKFSGEGGTGLSAGVWGEVGEDATNTDAAFLAILGGDSGELDAQAAYGVRYLNSTPGSKFDYGLDLLGSVAGYQDVTFAQADIRLSTGAAIASGTGAPASSAAGAGFCNLGAGMDGWPRGSLYLRTDGSANNTLYTCTATDTWTAVSNEP